MSRKESDAAYYQANKERIKARSRARYEAKREEILAASRAAYKEDGTERRAKNRAWADANRDKMRAYHAEYVSRNRALWSAQTALYRAAKKQATPAWADKRQIKAFYDRAQQLKQETGDEWHVDHIVPLQSHLVCGLHTHTNLQVLRGFDNRSKSNTTWPDAP